MIRLEQLRFGYNRGDDVLRLDEFVLEPESNILVVGPSGCGKTTLLHLIAGLLVPTGGSVVVDGQDLSALSPPARDRFRGRHIGIVLQQFHLLPTLTAMQNLLVAQSIAGLPVDRSAAHVMLSALGVDERVRRLSASTLGRPAAARRHRPGARESSQAAARRRADVESRRRGLCVGSRSAAQRDAAACGVAGHRHPRHAPEIEDPAATRIAASADGGAA